MKYNTPIKTYLLLMTATFSFGGCTLITTPLNVAGSVVETTASVTGSVISSTADAVFDSDEEEKSRD